MFCNQCGTKQKTQAKFCSTCGVRLGEEDSFNALESFDHRAYAFNVVFGETFQGTEELSDYAIENQEQINKLAVSNNPEALLKLALLLTTFEDNFRNAPEVAKSAIESAKKGRVSLDRYYFVLGVTQREVRDIDACAKSFEKSLELDFAPAALFLGLLGIEFQKNLRSAVYYFQLGVEKYNEDWCKLNLKSLETEPGVFTCAFPLEDGSLDIVSISDKPGGFGPMPR